MEKVLPLLAAPCDRSVQFVLALTDTLNVLNGKWKLPIIGALLAEQKRFRDIQRSLPRITPRMLVKELRELEINGIVTRRVYDTHPVLIEYELTPSAWELREVLDQMAAWGTRHRAAVLGTA